MKKLSAILLLVILFTSLLTLPVLANKTDYLVEDFNDLISVSGTKHWAYNQISELISMGILKGYDGGTIYNEELGEVVPVQLVKPEQKVTRAEFAALLYQTLNLAPENDSAGFTDNIPAWAKDAINTLYDDGIIKGNPDGTFKPNNHISRAEIATMLVQSLNDKAPQTGKYFPDITSSEDHWAYDFVAKASAMGIINGQPDGKFAPDRSATRAEVAVMLYQFMVRDASQVPADSVLLERTDSMLQVIEEAVNAPGPVDLSAAKPCLTGREEATLADSTSVLNDMKEKVSVGYQVTYPGTVINKSDRWAEVLYQTLITIQVDDQKSEQQIKEHYYLMKMGDKWYVYADSLEEEEAGQ